MFRHVLAIYCETAAGKEVLGRARAIVDEHDARLTVGVTSAQPSRPGGCAVSGARWDAIMREEAQRTLTQARSVLGETAAEFTVIEGDRPQVIAAAAESRECDLVLVTVGGMLRRRGVARALGHRLGAVVVGVPPRQSRSRDHV
jgi:nucleotide-binding universal stress UspA family protein